MVKIKTMCRILIWRTFVRIPWHVIPEPPATFQSAATWRIQCHDPRATCRIAGCATGRIQWRYPRAKVLPLGEFTVMIPEPRATLQGVIIPSAILKIVFRHIFFSFFNAVWA